MLDTCARPGDRYRRVARLLRSRPFLRERLVKTPAASARAVERNDAVMGELIAPGRGGRSASTDPLAWVQRAEDDGLGARSALRRKVPLIYGATFHV